MIGVGELLALGALAVSFVVLWRTEFRGPSIQAMTIPGSVETEVLGGTIGEKYVGWNRDVLFTNSGSRIGYVARVDSTVSDMSVAVDAEEEVRFGVLDRESDGGHIRPASRYRWDVLIEPNESARLTFRCLFLIRDLDEDAILTLFQGHRGVLAMEATWHSRERRWWRQKFKTRTIQVFERRGDGS